MSLHDLRREYDERRRALIAQLQGNSGLDAATQHQIYGAIKEIENFLATIDAHQQVQQERGLNVELSRERPRPFVERTQKVFHKVRSGTGRVFKHHIPRATRAVVTAPKRYFDKRSEEKRLRREIEAELRARRAAEGSAPHNSELVVLEHPHQVLEAAERPTPSLPEVPVTPQPHEPALMHKGAPIDEHPKRRKVIEKSARSGARPSKHAGGKKGGQHKPHQKRGNRPLAQPSKAGRRR